MFTPVEDKNMEDKSALEKGLKEENKFQAFLKHFLVFVLLIGVIVASFWVSFLLGKKMLLPARRTPRQKIEVAIPEPPPSIAKLQRLEEVPKISPKPDKKISLEKSTAKKAQVQKYWRVQAGVFKSKDNALSLSEKLKAAGFQSCLKQVRLKSLGLVYRVQVGIYTSRTKARELQKKLIQKGFEAAII
jgi:cell division septation protein DedD